MEMAGGAREWCPQAGEQSTTSEGAQEEAWACRRSKVPLLGRSGGGGVGLP